MDTSVDIYPEELAYEEYVNRLIAANKVVMFSKSKCPHCSDSKALLNDMGIEYTAVELDHMKDGRLVQNVLGDLTDARTVPRIFIDGKCVGGNSDLQTLNKRGQLKEMLKDV